MFGPSDCHCTPTRVSHWQARAAKTQRPTLSPRRAADLPGREGSRESIGPRCFLFPRGSQSLSGAPSRDWDARGAPSSARCRPAAHFRRAQVAPRRNRVRPWASCLLASRMSVSRVRAPSQTGDQVQSETANWPPDCRPRRHTKAQRAPRPDWRPSGRPQDAHFVTVSPCQPLASWSGGARGRGGRPDEAHSWLQRGPRGAIWPRWRGAAAGGRPGPVRLSRGRPWTVSGRCCSPLQVRLCKLATASSPLGARPSGAPVEPELRSEGA